MSRLDSICRIFTGLPPRLRTPESEVANESLALVGIRSITGDGELDRKAIESFHISAALPKSAHPLELGDVLLSIRGSLPKCTIVEEPFSSKTFASGNLAVLRPDMGRIVPSFLWSFLLRVSQNEHHPLLARATTQQLSIRIGDLAALQIPLHSLAEQAAIGNAALALRNALRAQRDVVVLAERTMRSFLADAFPAV